MTALTALCQMTDIDPAFIADADTTPARRFPVRAVVAIAACAAILCAAVWGYIVVHKQPEPLLITEYAGCAEPCYAAPCDGEVLRELDLKLTMAKYKDENVLFWVALDIHSENGTINFNKIETAAECDRLSKLGYDVYIHQRDWKGYWGEDKHYTSVYLKLSADEINNFAVASTIPQYGYIFHAGEYLPDDCVLYK